MVEKMSKNVVSTLFVPSLIDTHEEQSVVKTLLPTGANRAFAVVEQRRADLGVLTPYPEVTPARRDDAGVDLDLTWAVSQEREIDPKQVYCYKMKELETFIRHDSLKIKAEKDTITKAKLESNNVKYFYLSDVSRVFNEFSRISMGRKVVIADASQ